MLFFSGAELYYQPFSSGASHWYLQRGSEGRLGRSEIPATAVSFSFSPSLSHAHTQILGSANQTAAMPLTANANGSWVINVDACGIQC